MGGRQESVINHENPGTPFKLDDRQFRTNVRVIQQVPVRQSGVQLRAFRTPLSKEPSAALSMVTWFYF